MTRLQPFRGWRHDLARAGADSLDDLLVPPYDVIDEDAQQAYYDRHPHNIIRAVLTRQEPGDDDHGNRYTRAAADMRRWRAEGVLRREAAPALYLLRERFRLPDGQTLTRTGLIARLRLAPWGHGILPHERTFPGAKADRLALTMATGCQFSPIFTLYSDPAGAVLAPLLQASGRAPDATLRTGAGVDGELWVVTDPAALTAASAALEAGTFYVADGHHRWETALNYQRFRRTGFLPDTAPPAPLSSWQAVSGAPSARPPADGLPQPHDFALVYAAAFEDPGVVILPTHRCLHDLAGFDAAKLVPALEARFDVIPCDDETLLADLAAAASGSHTYALILPGQGPGYLLQPRDRAETGAILHAADHPAVAAIDVAALQTLILGPLLHIGRDANEQKRYLTTTPDTQAAITQTRAGRFQAAFLVNPTTLAQLRAASDAGQVTPPKATFFYPKLPSGLVVNCM